MIKITNLEDELIYKNYNDFEPDSLIDAIVKAGGVDNINIYLDPDNFNLFESMKIIKFLNDINYDLNKTFQIEHFDAIDGRLSVELIKNGYDMYKVGRNKVPDITKCGYKVLEECLKRGLDLNKFDKENHFTVVWGYDEEYYNENTNSHFIESNNSYSDAVDNKKLELLLAKDFINSETLTNYQSRIPLYYSYYSEDNLNEKVFEKLLSLYNKIDIDESYLFRDSHQLSRSFILKRYIETSEDKQDAVNNILEMFESNGYNIQSKEHSATLEVITNHFKKEQNEIQEAFTQTALKPSTRRRM
ncbi:hypothetical protein NUG39_26855 (plasmid) [Citrobacter youngae]|uniref:hypothetical protein n=1 Tax=Citrobacter youngae TaxID=133448 RepID=UPI00214FB40C|nr:hypothetical protein [Citrobacter youngae]UUX57416.1 hypothetical protein NUG39_26855 [Citrobacter youngae]